VLEAMLLNSFGLDRIVNCVRSNRLKRQFPPNVQGLDDPRI
jgi:hypothetical protein